MSCPHSLLGSPDRCSSCLEAAGRLPVPVRRIEQIGSLVSDGETARPLDQESADLRARFAHKTRRRG